MFSWDTIAKFIVGNNVAAHKFTRNNIILFANVFGRSRIHVGGSYRNWCMVLTWYITVRKSHLKCTCFGRCKCHCIFTRDATVFNFSTTGQSVVNIRGVFTVQKFTNTWSVQQSAIYFPCSNCTMNQRPCTNAIGYTITCDTGTVHINFCQLYINNLWILTTQFDKFTGGGFVISCFHSHITGSIRGSNRKQVMSYGISCCWMHRTLLIFHPQWITFPIRSGITMTIVQIQFTFKKYRYRCKQWAAKTAVHWWKNTRFYKRDWWYGKIRSTTIKFNTKCTQTSNV